MGSPPYPPANATPGTFMFIPPGAPHAITDPSDQSAWATMTIHSGNFHILRRSRTCRTLWPTQTCAAGSIPTSCRCR